MNLSLWDSSIPFIIKGKNSGNNIKRLMYKIEEVEDIYMQIILHTKYVDKIVIGGEFV
jgi:hypothetical protein